MTSSSSSSSPPTASSPGEPGQAGEPGQPGQPGQPGELDLRGEVCPFTFVRTKLALEALPFGAVLRVLVDHEPAIRNIPRSATEWGQELVEVAPLAVAAGARAAWSIDLRKRVR